MDSSDPLESLSDHELLVRSAKDGRAFERFCERCLPSLYRYSVYQCRVLGGPPPDLAAEFVHDAILKVLRLVAENGGGGAPAYPRSLLRVIIRRQIIDWLRRNSVSEFMAEMPADVEAPPEESVEDADEVRSLLNLLRPEEVNVIERVLLVGVSFEALAEELDLTVDAATQRYYRALRRLRDMANVHGRSGRRRWEPEE